MLQMKDFLFLKHLSNDQIKILMPKQHLHHHYNHHHHLTFLFKRKIINTYLIKKNVYYNKEKKNFKLNRKKGCFIL